MASVVSAATLIAALWWAPAGAQDPAAIYDEGLFQLVIPDLPPAPIPVLVDSTGQLLFPLGPILETAGIPFAADTLGLHIELIDANRQAVDGRITAAGGAVVRGEATAEPGSGEILERDGEHYLSARLIAFLIDAEVVADFARLELRVLPRAPLPASLAAEAARRRQLALLRASGVLLQPPPAPLLPRTGGGVLHYSLSSGVPSIGTSTVLMLEAGAALFGGSAMVGHSLSPEADLADPALTFRYERYIPGTPAISFVRLGDVVAEGAFLRSVRGATITNRPLRRRAYFQDVEIPTDVPPGYEIEVYRGGQLIAFTGGGSEALRVPLTYGRTDLEVRMIAPSGEVVTRELLFGIPLTQLPQGEFEYAAGGGACHYQDCEIYFAAADYGVRRWVTMGAGWEAVHDSTGLEHTPFARAWFAPAGGWLGEARIVVGRQYSASAQYRGPSAWNGLVAIDVNSPSTQAASVLPQSATRWNLRGDLGRGRHRGQLRLGGMEGSGLDRWGLGYMTALRSGLLITRLESFTDRPLELTLNGFRVLPMRPFGARLSGSARTSVSGEGFQRLEIGASAGWDGNFFANLSVGWERTGGPGVTLSFSRSVEAGQLAGVFSASGQADTRATLRADGALAFDPPAAVMPAGYTGIGFAGVDALVFRDANANGVLDSGEEPAADVVVRVGERTATSGADGHARVWGLVPWEVVLVHGSPDPRNPQWAPREDTTALRPVAHVFNPVLIPLVPSRELIALVIAGDGVRGSAGIRYRLVNERTGATRTGLTLGDGSIYETAVRAGPYRIEFDEADLRFLDAEVAGAPIRFEIGTDGADEFVQELPPIELRPLGD